MVKKKELKSVEKEGVAPSGVVDIESYNKMLTLQNNKVFSEDIRIVQTSDDDLEIDLFMTEAAIKKAIDHLPDQEREDLIKRSRSIRMLKGKVDNLKAKAYGSIRVKSHSSVTSIVLNERAPELMEYFGKFFSAEEVYRIVNEQWGIKIALKSIQNFQRKNYTEIKKTQDIYARDHRDVRLSHKKARLEELTVLYQSRKDRYQITDSREDVKLMLQILKLINDIVDGQHLKIAGEITHKIETTINYSVQQEVMKGLTINDIIIARVAARNGINPQFLSARLHQSIYAKHSGFASPSGDIGEQEISYPSSMVYNWDEVKKLHEKKDLEDAELIKYKEVPEDEKAGFEEVKRKLLERVKARKEAASQARKRIDDNDKK